MTIKGGKRKIAMNKPGFSGFHLKSLLKENLKNHCKYAEK